jgi:hypothetical protein
VQCSEVKEGSEGRKEESEQAGRKEESRRRMNGRKEGRREKNKGNSME